MKRYTTTLFCLLIALLSLSSLQVSANSPARVLLGGRELISAPSIRSDNEVYISLKMLDSLGASYAAADSSETVSVTSASGSTGNIKGRFFGDNLMLPVSKVAGLLDAISRWDESVNAVRLTAKLKSVEFVDGELKINTTLPVASSVTEWKTAGKVIVDIYGTKLDTEAREVLIGSSDVQRVRLGQFEDETARVVVDLARSVRFQRVSDPISTQTVVKFALAGTLPGVKNQSSPVQVTGPTGALTGIEIEPINDDKLHIKLSTSGKIASQSSFHTDPLSLIIELLNAELAIPEEEIEVDHPLVKSVRIENTPEGFRIRVILNVNRFVAYNVDSSDGQILISIALPVNAGGSMAGKTIVIDPGHGGRQTGTRAGGCQEKVINLQIAKRVHRLLLAEGANAVLTRNGDNALSYDLKEDLQARPALARKVGADLFVSIHCNSNRSSSICGTETYYHMTSASGRALAQAIQANIVKETGMHDRKAKSDNILYKGIGLAVLRHATVPAVLVEAGFLSNYQDRIRLINPDFQEKMARGIVNGIKAYIEGAR